MILVGFAVIKGSYVALVERVPGKEFRVRFADFAEARPKGREHRRRV